MSIRIFVKAPYDQWVNTSTRFWNASGVDVSFNANANGLNIYTESLVSLFMAGCGTSPQS